jgi:hypothetical protein
VFESAFIPALRSRVNRNPLARQIEHTAERRAQLFADPLLSLKDAKAVLRVSEATVRRWIKLGILPVVRYHPRGHLKIRQSALQAMLAKGDRQETT